MTTAVAILGADLFDIDERVFINSCAAGESLEVLTRERLLRHIAFTRMSGDNEDIASLADGLREKIGGLSDEDWDELKMLLPFPVTYGLDSAEEEAT